MMLTTLLASAALTAASPAADLLAAEREAMKALAWMDGEWRGTATALTHTGEQRVTHTERSGPLLGGAIRLVEGHSYRDDGSTGFNAFAMIRFDPVARTYHMASHAEGRFGDFKLDVLPDGYRWSIPAGPATITYRATLANGVWTEIGERVMPGAPPRQVFRMEMRRIADSRWPAANPVAPK